MRGSIFIAAALLLAGGRAAAAEDAPICADRPGKATAACTVSNGRWQLEAGLADWSIQKSSGDRNSALALAETTIKYGLTSSSDIELDVTPFERETTTFAGITARASGIGDVNAVYKQRLTPSGAPLQLVAMPYVKIPIAKRSLSNGEWEGGVLLPISYAIAKSPLSIGATPELDWVADGDGRGHHLAMTQVISLGVQVSEKLNLSAELWGHWDWDHAGATRQTTADVAAAYLVNRNFQLDAGANFGLNRATPDLELYTGVSVRF